MTNNYRYSDRATIAMPRLPYDCPREEWFIVGPTAPVELRKAATTASMMLRREIGCDGGFTWHSHWEDHLFAAAYAVDDGLDWSKPYSFRLAGVAWAICARRADGKVNIIHLWVHPFHRHKGLMARTWPELLAVIGDPQPWIEPPWSKATEALLAKVGHVQPDPDTPETRKRLHSLDDELRL